MQLPLKNEFFYCPFNIANRLLACNSLLKIKLKLRVGDTESLAMMWA